MGRKHDSVAHCISEGELAAGNPARFWTIGRENLSYLDK
jgi:hypothetical protein